MDIVPYFQYDHLDINHLSSYYKYGIPNCRTSEIAFLIWSISRYPVQFFEALYGLFINKIITRI